MPKYKITAKKEIDIHAVKSTGDGLPSLQTNDNDTLLPGQSRGGFERINLIRPKVVDWRPKSDDPKDLIGEYDWGTIAEDTESDDPSAPVA